MTTDAVGGRHYEFGLTDRLRISRELAGYGQRDLAEATGISRGSIINYENGTTEPKRPQLIAWAMATGFSLEWLMTGVNSGESGPDKGGRGGTEVTQRYLPPVSELTLKVRNRPHRVGQDSPSVQRLSAA